MTHAINFVDDCELPTEHDFLFVAVPEGALIFYRQSGLSPTVLEDSWTAFRRIGTEDDWRTPTRLTPRDQRPILSLVSNG